LQLNVLKFVLIQSQLQTRDVYQNVGMFTKV